MKKFTYYNPVRIEFGINKLELINKYINKRRAILITSKGFRKRKVIEKIQTLTDKIELIIDDTEQNPTFDSLRLLYDRIWKNDFDLIIALGGGSVIDSAKVLSVYNKFKNFSYIENTIKDKTENKDFKIVPLIAFPTTAGTGSEVTPWATIWDMNEKKKYSLHLENLWPEACICDPLLTQSLPKNITIQAALDALSHSLESIWNKNANPISTQHAFFAAREILETLPKLVLDLQNLEYREKIQLASLQAGLAFSNTQTAIAHAISYYITTNKGIPHGIACSFLLPIIIDSVIGKNEHIDNFIRNVMGELSSKKLKNLYSDLNISTNIKDYNLDKSDVMKIKNSILKTSRANNSLINSENLFNLLEIMS